MDHQPYTSADFQTDVHRQLVDAAVATLADARLPWSRIAPILDAGRAVCRDDVRLNGRLAIHGMEYEGADLVDAQEAYLSISVSDREDHVEWLSQTYWLSDLALADREPERVRSAIAAIERSLARLKDWLADQEAEPDNPAPTAAGEGSEPPAGL